MYIENVLKQHMHIGLDLDETLAATMQGLIFYAHGIGELKHIQTVSDIKKHDASWLRNDMTREESIKLWEWYGQSTMEPHLVSSIDRSHDCVRQLFEQWKRLSIVTARSNEVLWKVERTHNWIKTHFPFIAEDDIHFVNHFSSDALPKSHLCKELGITLMIDDALENAYDLCHAGIGCILLEKPWNRDIEYDHPLLYRVKDWNILSQALQHG
jgi:5'(3')-deoxyribonucleotidase